MKYKLLKDITWLNIEIDKPITMQGIINILQDVCVKWDKEILWVWEWYDNKWRNFIIIRIK